MSAALGKEWEKREKRPDTRPSDVHFPIFPIFPTMRRAWSFGSVEEFCRSPDGLASPSGLLERDEYEPGVSEFGERVVQNLRFVIVRTQRAAELGQGDAGSAGALDHSKQRQRERTKLGPAEDQPS